MNRLSLSLSRLFQDRYLLEFIEEIVLKMVWRMPHFLLYYDRFFILSHDFATPAVCTGSVKKIRTRVAGTADIPALLRFLDRGELYAARFKRGDRVVVAELDDKIVGMEWIEIDRDHYEDEHEYRFHLPDGFAWTYDGYVAPAYRGKGFLTSMESEVVRHLRQYSFHATYTIVKALNRPSLNSQLRNGYRKRRQVVFIRFLFLRIYLEKNLDQTVKNDAWQASFACRKLWWKKKVAK